MSQNSKDNNTNNINFEVSSADIKNFDANRVSVKLLIITSSLKKFDQTLTYLTRRGWQTAIESNIRQVFQAIGEFKPDFILLSANYESNKLAQLPALFKNTFQTPVVLIGEKTDTLTMKNMSQIQADFKLSGLPTGPGIHRGIKNILSDLSLTDSYVVKKIITRGSDGISNDSSSDEIKKKQKKGYSFTIEESSEPNRNEQMANSYEEYFSKTDSVANNKKKDFAFSTDVAASTNTVAGTATNSESGASKTENGKSIDIKNETQIKSQESQLKIIDKNGTDYKPQSTTDLNKSVDKISNTVAGTDVAASTNTVAGTATNSESGASKTENGKSIDIKNEKNSIGNIIEIHNKKNRAAGVHSIIPQKIDGKNITVSTDDELKLEEDIKQKWGISINLGEAILKSVISSYETGQNSSTTTQHSIIIPLKSSEMRGYAILSYQGLLESAENYFSRFSDLLMFEIKNANMKPSNQKSIIISDTEISTKEKLPGEVLRKEVVIEGEGQIIIKLIEGLQNKLDYEYLEKDKKFKLKPSVLISGQSQGTDLYIHLPKNEKYFLYLRRHSSLSEKQKVNLIKSDASIFIEKDEFNEFKETHERNSLIHHIKSTVKSKKAS